MNSSKTFIVFSAFFAALVSGTFALALPDLPLNYFHVKQNQTLQQTVLPPSHISHRIWPSKKAVTLTWDKPQNTNDSISYQVIDSNNHLLWQGTNTTFTDSSLAGKHGKVTYYLYSNNKGQLSPKVTYEISIN